MKDNNKPVHLELETLDFGDVTVCLQRTKRNRQRTSEDVQIIHSHDYYELHLVKRGKYDFTVEDVIISAQSGSLLVLDPGCTHKIVQAQKDTEVLPLGLRIIKKGSSYQLYDYLISCLQRNARTPLQIEKTLVNKIANYYYAPARKSVHQLFRRKLEACDIITQLFEAMASDTLAEEVVYGNSFDMLLEVYVNDPGITLREIAVQLGYSERQLNRKIHARYGMGLRAFRKSLINKKTEQNQ